MGNSDIVLMPYNYLIDLTIRAKNPLQYKNAILIIDEAHNILSTAEDAYSFSISADNICLMIREWNNVIKIMFVQPLSKIMKSILTLDKSVLICNISLLIRLLFYYTKFFTSACVLSV